MTVKRLIAKLQYITPGTRHQSDKAIAILCHNASSDDMREWAERYLCGMTDVDAATYMAQRQSQS